jgi:hypothetical protein
VPQASVTVSGTVAAAPSGNKSIGPYTVTNTNSILAVTDFVSVSGDNVITVPSTTATGCVIDPPAGNTAVIKLKGAAGDLGIPLHLTFSNLLVFNPGLANFILNIGAAGLSFEITWF